MLSRARARSRSSVQPERATPTTGTTVIAINCGGAASAPFVADADFAGGGTFSVTAAIATAGVTNPAPQPVYQSADVCDCLANAVEEAVHDGLCVAGRDVN